MSDEIEYVILNKKECFVYNVPPATSATGYKAADWANCIWKGRLQVCAKGEILIIKLLDSNTGAIFAACPIPPNMAVDKIVERTVDSSRYFVLTMSDKTGRKAYLGMGFDDRNDAFDFNATLSDFKRQKEAPEQVIKPVVKVQPPPDLSLREGQKITVNLKPLRAPPSGPSSDSQPITLMPPPAGKSRVQTNQTSDLLDFGEPTPAPQPSTSNPPPSASAVPSGSLLD